MPFHSVTSLLAYMQEGQGKPMTLTVQRNGATLAPIVVHPSGCRYAQWKLGFMAVPSRFDPPMHQLADGVYEAASEARDSARTNSLLIVEMLQQVDHDAGLCETAHRSSGNCPAAGEAAETKGWCSKFGSGRQRSVSTLAF